MKKIIYIFFVFFLMLPTTSFAARIELVPSSLNVKEGDAFYVSIFIVPENGEKFYSAKVPINFSTDTLLAQSVSVSKQFLELPVPEYNILDNNSGLIVKAGGIIGGASDKILFGTVNFLSKKAGEAKIFVRADAEILDKNSNNIFSSSNLLNLLVKKPANKYTPVKTQSAYNKSRINNRPGNKFNKATILNSINRDTKEEENKPSKSDTEKILLALKKENAELKKENSLLRQKLNDLMSKKENNQSIVKYANEKNYIYLSIIAGALILIFIIFKLLYQLFKRMSYAKSIYAGNISASNFNSEGGIKETDMPIKKSTFSTKEPISQNAFNSLETKVNEFQEKELMDNTKPNKEKTIYDDLAPEINPYSARGWEELEEHKDDSLLGNTLRKGI